MMLIQKNSLNLEAWLMKQPKTLIIFQPQKKCKRPGLGGNLKSHCHTKAEVIPLASQGNIWK